MNLGTRDTIRSSVIKNPLTPDTIEFSFYQRGYMPNFHITLISEAKEDFDQLVKDVGNKFFMEDVQQLS